MRTEQGIPVQSTRNGKWSATFVTYNGNPGHEWIANDCTSAPVFDTEDEAREAASRALDMLEKTGMFPNMCEAF
jgi:ABC-type glycerol-3-phosphate transport system substrate-binding protein